MDETAIQSTEGRSSVNSASPSSASSVSGKKKAKKKVSKPKAATPSKGKQVRKKAAPSDLNALAVQRVDAESALKQSSAEIKAATKMQKIAQRQLDRVNRQLRRLLGVKEEVSTGRKGSKGAGAGGSMGFRVSKDGSPSTSVLIARMLNTNHAGDPAGAANVTQDAILTNLSSEKVPTVKLSLAKMVRQGFASKESSEAGTFYKLTESGSAALAAAEAKIASKRAA